MFDQQVSDKFWKSQKQYPNFGDVRSRWAYDLVAVTSFVPDIGTLCDLGCGTGILAALLCQVYPITLVELYDIADTLLQIATHRIQWHATAKSEVVSWDEFIGTSADLTLMMGVLPYMQDTQVNTVLSRIHSKYVILRSGCPADDRIEINKVSTELGAQYSAIYRPVTEIARHIEQYFDIKDIRPAWPKALDSRFGNTQTLFLCTHKQGQ